jgi:hypothetical protein
MIYRMTYLGQFTELAIEWCGGVKSLLHCHFHPALGRKRTLARFLQFFIGTLGLYTMATWWPAYSNLLGASSTLVRGPWWLFKYAFVQQRKRLSILGFFAGLDMY